MNFVYPQFLWALLTLAIPVIIHLFYFRRFKKVFFSNVRFLNFLKEENQTRNKLRNLLVLILRMLALAALVIAFAQPYFPSGQKTPGPSQNLVTIFIDNSFSMEAIEEEGNLLQVATGKTEEILNAYRSSDEFRLITNDFLPEQSRFLNKEDLKQKLAGVDISPQTKTLGQILERVRELPDRKENIAHTVYLISDFQKSTFGFSSQLNIDSTANFFLVPLKPNAPNNLFIDTAWLENPIYQVNQQNSIKFRIKNTSDKDYKDQSATLTLNGKQKGITSFDLAKNTEKVLSINFTITDAGFNEGWISINDYPVNFDDKYFLTFPVRQHLNVLAINGTKSNSYLKALYQTDPYFNYNEFSIGNLDLQMLSRSDFIVLNEVPSISSGLASSLREFVEKGGNLLLIPAKNADITEWNKLLSGFGANNIKNFNSEKRELSDATLNDPFFKDIFEDIPNNVNLPKINQFFEQTSRTGTRQRVLLRTRTGETIFSYYPFGSGSVFLSSIAFDNSWSSLPKHAIFVPLLYKTSFFNQTTPVLAYSIGSDNTLTTGITEKRRDEVFKLEKEDFEIIPPQKSMGGKVYLYAGGQIPGAGIYDLTTNTSEITGKKFAFNYNRAESELAYWSEEELKQFTQNLPVEVFSGGSGNLSASIEKFRQGKVLWKYFILIALGLLLLEIIIIKLIKK